MVQLSATRCSCIVISRVSLVSFAAITLCVASQRVLIVYCCSFLYESVRKLLDIPSYFSFTNEVSAIESWRYNHYVMEEIPLTKFRSNWKLVYTFWFIYITWWQSQKSVKFSGLHPHWQTSTFTLSVPQNDAYGHWTLCDGIQQPSSLHHKNVERCSFIYN
jgi:hypothetical protein